MTWLDDATKIAQEATPGPWDNDSGTGRLRKPRGVIGGDAWDTEQAGADATFIATFDPPTVLALLDVVRAAALDHNYCSLCGTPGEEPCGIGSALAKLEQA